MGWASFYEDIIRRLNDDLQNLLRETSVGLVSDGSARERLATVHRACSSLIKEVKPLLEIVTDPNFQLAARHFFELNELQQKVAGLEKEIVELHKSNSENTRNWDMLHKALLTDIARLTVDLEAERRKNRTLRRDLKDFRDPQSLLGQEVRPLKAKGK